MKYLILSLLMVQSIYSLNAQKIEYKGYFIKENKTIGDTIYFISTINYPKNIELIQPDSSNDYKTFEYIDKLIFPSLKIEDRVLDSTIYLLRTFNTDTIQSLQLSSYIINNSDSLKITSTEDNLIISNQIKNISFL